MKRFYEDKIVPIGQPSQRRWVSRAHSQCLCVHVCVRVWELAIQAGVGTDMPRGGVCT